MSRLCSGAVVFLAVLLLLEGRFVARAEEAAVSEAVDEILCWLPVDTESLRVAQGPFRLSAANAQQLAAVETMQTHTASLITDFLKETIEERLGNEPIAVVVEGSRNFKLPKENGPMPFEGCQVLKFEESAHAALRKVFRDCADEADGKILLAGNKVLTFKKRAGKDEWSVYVALPRNGILLCASDREYLKVVLQRMNGEAEGRALPKDLLEWQYVNRKAPVWGIRHYCRATAATDPTSPFRDKTPVNVPDAKAIGITYSLEHESRTARIAYLSRASNAQELAVDPWNRPADGLTAIAAPIAPAVVEVTCQHQNEDGLINLIIQILRSIGHAIDL